jgi:hypothetical protein
MPAFAACRPTLQPDGMNLTVGPNVSVQVERGLTVTSLITYSDAFLQRIGAQPERVESGSSGVRVEYRLQPSGRFGIATFAVAGNRVYAIVFEPRNLAACGESSPTEIYDLLLRTLRFLP